MKTTVTSVLVDDQAKALTIYADIISFQAKDDIPLGRHRWLRGPVGTVIMSCERRAALHGVSGRGAANRCGCSAVASRSQCFEGRPALATG